ncbi:MFS transporter [Jiangella anatolica]|uniref:MFS transporter n=1 Tax=Jiangella anatolica TaxID=2670374 RepID=UPI0018F3B337|nr:MFS transporter [Jiangella anatolica]
MSAEPPFPPPGFRRFWAGEAVSGLGSYVTLLALQTLVVLDLEGGATEVGWVSSARWLPYLLFGLAVGALVDRVRRRPVMIASDLTRAALLLAIPAAWAADLLTFPLLVAIVACFGAASLVNDAASMAFLPRLVPRAHLQRAHARIDGADAVAQTAGPALGGLLVRWVGAPLAILADAVSYVFAAVMVATTRMDEPRVRTGGPAPSLRREIAEGVRWVYGASGLARLAVATHVWFAGNAVVSVAIPVWALRELGLSPAVLGLTTAAAGVGALLGAVVTTAVSRRIGTGGAIIAAHAVSMVAVIVAASAGAGPAAVLLGAGQALHGFAMGLSNSHEMAYRQALSPDTLQARTNTTMRSFNRAVIVVVSPLAGMLADRLGPAPALVLAAAIFAAVVLMLLVSPFRHVRLTGWQRLLGDEYSKSSIRCRAAVEGGVVAATRPSNPLALAVLVLLWERPMHPYEMSSTLRERRKEDSIKLNYGSLYSVVDSLQKRGLVEATETVREGRRPERTVYAITDAGGRVMVDWLVELLSTPKKEFTQFEAALTLAAALPPEQVTELLSQRLRNLHFRQKAVEAMFAEAATVKLPRLFMIEAEFSAALLSAETTFVEQLLADLRDGSIGGFAMWQRVHELRRSGLPPEEIEAKINAEFADELTFVTHYEKHD